ncbi:HAD family hydrolase [Cupriavidus sp. YAF13]|uniref:HAD family hydrolase n=1 Tax=Cupriavidus sp. YAF13 TaxID=3233075 RepID=UPI003F9282F2
MTPQLSPQLSRQMSPFTAAIFDMDGLLIDSERAIMQAWIGAAREIGITLAASDYVQVIGKAKPESDAFLVSLLGDEHAFRQVQVMAGAQLHAPAAGPRFPLKPGAKELLSALRAAGIPCAVASSSRVEEIKDRLGRVGVLDFFSSVSGGDEVRRGKPDPALYQLAAERLGVAPQACLAFEDSENGATAASRSGAQVVVVPDIKPPSAVVTGFSFRILGTLHEAIPFVPQWFDRTGPAGLEP